MAKYSNGKLKEWHVVVMDGYNTLFNRKCFNVAEANKLLAEKKEEYKGNRNIAVFKEQF
jgi:hypothetical protein